MRKGILTLLFLTSVFYGWAQVREKEVSVPAKLYRYSDNSYAGNTTVTMRMASDVYGKCLVIEANPFPEMKHGIVYAYNQGSDSDATFQTIVVDGEAGWIVSSKFRQEERIYVALYEGADGTQSMHVFIKNNETSPPDYYLGYYMQLTPQDEWILRRYLVENGTHYKLFRDLEPIKE